MTAASFVHLHVHSEYSLLDGAARIEAPESNPAAPTIFTEAERLGMPAVGDHRPRIHVRGAPVLRGRPRRGRITPIIGVEAYVAPGSRFDRNPGGERGEVPPPDPARRRTRPATATSCGSCRLAHLEGFYHRPRMDKQLLAEHAEGVICLSGCLSIRGRRSRCSQGQRAARPRRGRPVPRHLRSGPTTSSSCRTTASRTSARSLRRQVELAAAIGVPVVATNDLHYTLQADAKPHDVLLCIQQQKLQIGSEAAEVRRRGVLPEEPRGDAPHLRRAPGGLRHHARDRRARAARPSWSSSDRSWSTRRIPPAAVRDARRRAARGLPPPAGRRRRPRPLRRAPAAARSATGSSTSSA